MASPNILSLKYNLSKRLPSRPERWISSKDRLDSSLSRTFHPNTDEMRKVFDKLDTNKDGKISRDELKRVLGALRNVEMEAAEVKSMIKVADLDNDGCINFKEFMDVHKKGGGIRASDIQRAFWMMDLDGDGRIGAKDLYGIFVRLGESCTLKACKKMVRAVDTNGNGLVDMDDFMAFMTRTLELSHV